MLLDMTIWTYQEWLESGHSRSELARQLQYGAVRRLRRGVVAARPSDEWEGRLTQRILATAPHLSPGTYFARETAAVIHQLPVMPWRTDEVVIYRTLGGHGSVRDTSHARRAALSSAECTLVDGLPVTSLERTVADLVRDLPFCESVAVADAALGRGLSPELLLALTAKGRGCRMARRAIEFADPAAESPGESVSRARMQELGIVLPELQVELRDTDDVFVGRVDFLWRVRSAGVIGEFDGAIKYGRLVPSGKSVDDVVEAERAREAALRALGFIVVRWTWDEVWDGTFAQRISRALRSVDG